MRALVAAFPVLLGALIWEGAHCKYPDDALEWQSAWPKAEGPGYGGSNGMFASPFIYKAGVGQSKALQQDMSDELWSFTLTGYARSGVVTDADGKMYVAATAKGDDAFPYIYCVDISSGAAPYYVWLESLDTTGASVFGSPLLAWEDGRRVLYVAATTSGTATLSDNTYIYAFATNSSKTSPTNKRTDLLWTYPGTVSAAFSNLGEIVGGGALHRNGTLMYGTRARGHPQYGGSNGVVAVWRGELAWQFSTGALPVSTNLITDGNSGGCCDFVYFVSGDGTSSTAFLHAVDVYTGSEKWKVTLEASEAMENPEPGNPGFGAYNDILVGFGEKLYSVDKKSGATNWASAISTTGPFTAAPAVWEDHYYVGNQGGRFYHLRPNRQNNGLALDPNNLKKGQLSEISKTFGRLLSSPLVFGNGAGVMQVDYDGQAIAWRRSGKKELWRYNYGTTISDARQPMMSAAGEILLGVGSSVVALGGSGGCLAGWATNDLSEVDADSPDNFCEICGSGNITSRVGSESCETCPPGKWSQEPGRTFCYRCERESWCLGGDRCLLGTEGVMCAQCIKGYYLLFTICAECPENPFIFTLLILAALMALMLLYMHFTRGTKFVYEVAKDDVVAIYVNNGTRCQQCCNKVSCGLLGTKAKRNECKVTRVIDDYSIEVLGNFGNAKRIKDVPYWLIKCRVYGDEVRKQGSGRVTVNAAVSLLGEEERQALKERDKQGVLEADSTEGFGDLSNLMKTDKVAAQTDLDIGVAGDDRSIVHGKSQNVGTEVIMAASLIMVGYAQSNAVFVSIPVGWPFFFVQFFAILSPLTSFDLSSLSVSPDCQWHWTYTRKFYSAMIFPLFLGLFLVLQYHVYEACVPHVLIRKQYQNKVINTFCIMMVLLYVFITAKTIEPFNCTTWEDGSQTLNKDPEISCNWTKNDQTEFTPYAFMAIAGLGFLFFYGIGIPATLFSMLYAAKVCRGRWHCASEWGGVSCVFRLYC
mmetsp:Transcript_12197/g.24758  ORF Transcript_12197/g.24758 Transcript_12197/m.24758 type:complete len:983 (+) Transcript_12197:51-2999(+)